jgi:transcriptional regulator with XRE-family HTH domain
MAIGRPRLREVRLSAGLTQQQLADRLGLDQAVIARWETGAQEPRVRAAVRLSEALGTTANALWPPDNESAPAPLERPGA